MSQRGAERIDGYLTELVALLEQFEEKRWAMAFGRVQEHVSVTLGAADTLSTARVVRDLLHMFRGGLGPFAGLTLAKDGVTDEEASARLNEVWLELRAELGAQLGG